MTKEITPPEPEEVERFGQLLLQMPPDRLVFMERFCELVVQGDMVVAAALKKHFAGRKSRESFNRLVERQYDLLIKNRKKPTDINKR